MSDIVKRLRGFVRDNYAVLRPKTKELMLEAAAEIERLQARIDALMLEYCPDEMTPEQMANWAAHQRPGSEPDHAAVAALKEQP